MHPEDETFDGKLHDPIQRLRHALKSPLTTIRGRAYLLARAVRRAPTLTEDERTRMLDGLTEIDTAVAAMVVVIDEIGDEHRDGSGHQAT